MKQGLIIFFLFLFNIHPILACGSPKRPAIALPPALNNVLQLLAGSSDITPVALENFRNNICLVCFENPATVWSDCGHLVQCSACTLRHIHTCAYGGEAMPGCSYCAGPATFYQDMYLLEHCTHCKTNLASIGHNRCRKLILCHACKTKPLHYGCPCCHSAEGKLIELYLSGTRNIDDSLIDLEKDPWRMLEEAAPEELDDIYSQQASETYSQQASETYSQQSDENHSGFGD